MKYRWQTAMMQAVRRRNGCDAAGTAWGEHSTPYASKTGTPAVTFILSGGHEFPRDAVPQMVKFLQPHSLATP